MTLAPDLARDKFFAALHEFGREAEKADWAVVYYAGHGMEIGGMNYLIPIDARLAGRPATRKRQAVALEQVIASVAGARSCGWSCSTPAATIRSKRPCSGPSR